MTLPDTLVSPSTWLAHSALLSSLLADTTGAGPNDCRRRDFQRLLSDNFVDIQRRNDAMLFRNLPPRKLERLGSLVVDIQILNSICSDTDMSTIPFFSSQIPDSTSSSSFVDKLETLLTWAVTPLQYGSHRPYAAVTLLQAYHERSARRELSSATLHDHLFDWLDTKIVAREVGNLRAVAILFGKLVKGGLFDYAGYVQRLVARGEEGLSCSEVFVHYVRLVLSLSYSSARRKCLLSSQFPSLDTTTRHDVISVESAQGYSLRDSCTTDPRRYL